MAQIYSSNTAKLLELLPYLILLISFLTNIAFVSKTKKAESKHHNKKAHNKKKKKRD